MITSTLNAAQILGVTQRQVSHAVQAGLLSSHRIGRDIGVFERQVFALRRMSVKGRRWDRSTLTAALDILSSEPVTTVSGTQLSRLKARLRMMSEAELAGKVLAGRVKLFRANRDQQARIGSAIADEAGLVGSGTCVLSSRRASEEAFELGLTEDHEGNVVAVDTEDTHRAVVEALAFIAYGNTRERSAGRKWLKERRLCMVGDQ